MIGHGGPTGPILIVLGIILVIVVGEGLWLYTSRRRGRVSSEVNAHQPMSVEDLLPSEDEDANEGEEGAGTVRPAATLGSPESIPGHMQRLRTRLASTGDFGKAILSVLSRGGLTEEDREEIGDTLLTSDLSIEVTISLMDGLHTQAKILGTSDPEAVRVVLCVELLKLTDPSLDRSLNLERLVPAEGAQGRPAATILMVEINGTGKTATCDRLARVLVAQDRTVVLGATDTLRVAAVEQLSTQGERVGVDVVHSEKEGASPASATYDATCEVATQKADVVVVDTVGRLQNRASLMDKLGKIRRVMEKTAPVGEILLVLDATTGQNGMRQIQALSEAVSIASIVLTKLNGAVKGGIVVTVQKELGIPVKPVGLREGTDDLAPFDPEDFVDALLS